MDPSADSPMDDEAALKEFNDPFQAISENFVRRRHAETDNQKVSLEDEQMLLTRMDAQDLEGRVMQDACLQMVAMNLVPQEVLAKMQEDFEFEKVRRRSFGLFRPTFPLLRPITPLLLQSTSVHVL